MKTKATAFLLTPALSGQVVSYLHARARSIDKPNMHNQIKCTQEIYASPFKLDEFTLSDHHGKACIYTNGLWCHNKSCNGPSCKFANLIQRRLVDGLYGCWGFHWQQELYTTEIRKAQRKFDLN